MTVLVTIHGEVSRGKRVMLNGPLFATSHSWEMAQNLADSLGPTSLQLGEVRYNSTECNGIIIRVSIVAASRGSPVTVAKDEILAFCEEIEP